MSFFDIRYKNLIKKIRNEKVLINFLDYFNQINIQILKVLINGYIEFDINEDEIIEKTILKIISKINNLL